MEGSGSRLLRSLWLERPIGYPECPGNVKPRKRLLPGPTCSTGSVRWPATCGAGLVFASEAGSDPRATFESARRTWVERAVRASLAGARLRERQVMMRNARRASETTVATYRDDPLYPRIERAVTRILAKGKVVAPVDVLVDMGLLAPEKLEDWRRGRVPHLEKVISCAGARDRSSGSASPRPATPVSRKPTRGTSCGRARVHSTRLRRRRPVASLRHANQPGQALRIGAQGS
jgi:hypothetical protein